MIQHIYSSLVTVFILKPRLSHISKATLSFFGGSASPYFQSEGVFRSKGNSLWVSCKQNIDGSCFFFPTLLPCVFWLEHLCHWRLEWVLKDMRLLPLCVLYHWILWWCFLCYTVFGTIGVFSLFFFFFPSFLPSESSSENSLRTCLVVTNSFKFYLSGKLLICPSILNDRLAG